MLNILLHDLAKLKNLTRAKNLARFFKTGKGEYGEGDVFWGITVSDQRKIAKKFFKEESLQEIVKLLHSKVHEQRLTALIMLTLKYKFVEAAPRLPAVALAKADGRPVNAAGRHRGLPLQKEIYDLYLHNTKWINNWDLVDLTAPTIIGDFIFCRSRRGGSEPVRLWRNPPHRQVIRSVPTEIIYLAQSKSLWERRISIVSTSAAIRQNNFSSTIKIAEILLNDKHDLIHKAVGWMLREVGKRDQNILLDFLNKHAVEMPRVMLRYSIERLEDDIRKKYLNLRSSRPV